MDFPLTFSCVEQGMSRQRVLFNPCCCFTKQAKQSWEEQKNWSYRQRRDYNDWPWNTSWMSKKKECQGHQSVWINQLKALVGQRISRVFLLEGLRGVVYSILWWSENRIYEIECKDRLQNWQHQGLGYDQSAKKQRQGQGQVNLHHWAPSDINPGKGGRGDTVTWGWRWMSRLPTWSPLTLASDHG